MKQLARGANGAPGTADKGDDLFSDRMMEQLGDILGNL